jgi:hypothetical protein
MRQAILVERRSDELRHQVRCPEHGGNDLVLRSTVRTASPDTRTPSVGRR